jgi:hypothetical protein
VVGRRRKHSEQKLDELLDEDAEREEPQGILEIFARDEDEPLTRNGDDDEQE